MESKPLKVLMFGWEFPPEISGGLGTACYGLVSGLIDNGVDVTFVVPKLYGTEETDKFRLVGASDINVNFSNDHFNFTMVGLAGVGRPPGRERRMPLW